MTEKLRFELVAYYHGAPPKIALFIQYSPIHRRNRFEKYISGKYLGEVVRVVMKSLVDKGLLFAKAPKELFPAPWKFGTDNVSHIEE